MWLLDPAVVSQDKEPRALQGRRARVTPDHRALTSRAASAPAPAPQPSSPAEVLPVPGTALYGVVLLVKTLAFKLMGFSKQVLHNHESVLPVL